MTVTHMRQPYYRPRFMGGDVEHPLCLATITGWAGPKVAGFPMTDDPGEVSCRVCNRHIAGGGMKSRIDELQARLLPLWTRSPSRRAA